MENGMEVHYEEWCKLGSEEIKYKIIINIHVYSDIWQVKQVCLKCQQNSLHNFMWKKLGIQVCWFDLNI